MAILVKIVGTGISGLLTAYYLKKYAQNSDIQIELYDQHDEKAENASTYSLAWINTIYPSKDLPSAIQAKADYDRFRLESLQAWHSLDNMLKKDGIIDVLATKKHSIKINDRAINALSIFFDSKSEADYIQKNERLKKYSTSYRTAILERDELTSIFPFIAKLPEDIQIHNISDEQLVNPRTLRMELIYFLKKTGVKFHWNTKVTEEMIQSELNSEWVLGAGNGCISLLKNTHLKNQTFSEKSLADIIEIDLNEPFDLKGKVFYFAASRTTPAFHLRNDELDPTRIKIIIASQGGKSRQLENDAKNILQLLQLKANKIVCVDDIERPMTPDGRPLVETQLGPHKNIHLVYGHSLFTNGAKLYSLFALHLTDICQKQRRNTGELEQFSAGNRFNQAIYLKDFSHFREKNNKQIIKSTEAPLLRSRL